MKRILSLILSLLLAATGLSALAEGASLPESFIPTTMMIQFNTRMPELFRSMGDPDPAGTTAKYLLSNPDMSGGGMRFSNDDGSVVLDCKGNASPVSPADTVSLSIAGGVNAIDATALKFTFLRAVADLDAAVPYEDLVGWLTGDAGEASLGDYRLTFEREGGEQRLTLAAGGAEEAPDAVEPSPTQAFDLSEDAVSRMLGIGGGDQPDAAPEPTPAPADGSVIFSWEGYSARLLSYKVFKSTNSTADLRVYVRVVNDTDRKLSLWCDDATADGVSVMIAPLLGVEPHTDTGEADPPDFYVFPKQENREAGSDAIATARLIQGTLRLKDSDSGEELASGPMRIELDDMDGIRNINTPRPTETPEPEPEIEADFGHGGAYVPDSSAYSELKKGSKGQAVRELQQRLIDLGYLAGKADGSYGKKTVAAVRLFCEQNGLDVYADGHASPQMQALLFSSSARGYSEMYNPLTISRGQWDPVRSANTFFFKAEVTNTSRTRTIKGFELNVYTTNVWGDKLDGGVIYTMSNKKTVKPGATGWSNSFNLGNWYSVDTVWIGISRIIFDDGEIRDIDNVSYSSVTLPDKK